MTETHDGFGTGAGIEEMFGSMIPSGRVGTAADVASAAVYLSSDEASYLNGVELMVDDGIFAAPARRQ